MNAPYKCPFGPHGLDWFKRIDLGAVDNPSAVQKRIAKLECAGLIKRKKRFDKGRGQQTNDYNLSELIREALPFAEEMVETRRQRQADDAESRKPWSPSLSVPS